MSEVAAKERSLSELLDKFVDAQKQDIHTYYGGHLNESRLYRSPDCAPYAKWVTVGSSQQPHSARHHAKTTQKRVATMKDSLFRFSVGISGLPVPELRSLTPDFITSYEEQHQAERSKPATCNPYINNVRPHSELGDITHSPLQTECVSQRKCVTDEAVLLSTSHLVKNSDFVADVKSANWCQTNVLPSHLATVTKKDQFRKMKEYETHVLRRPDAYRRQILTGTQAVKPIEAHLQQRLKGLNATLKNDAPSFHRLIIYIDTFEELIESSSTFRHQLQEIKDAYDDYLSTLLDSQSAGHGTLQADVMRLFATHVDVAPKLDAESNRVQQLEQQARKLLEENESLRKELAKELELACQLPPDNMQPVAPAKSEEMEPSEQIEQLRVAILDKMEAVRHLRTKLRVECVPSSVCTYLSQCLKDTNIETQKILSQKEYFERSISQLERDLHDAVESADTTERDAKRIWKRIDLIKSDSITATANRDALETDEDESAKWSWYIS